MKLSKILAKKIEMHKFEGQICDSSLSLSKIDSLLGIWWRSFSFEKSLDLWMYVVASLIALNFLFFHLLSTDFNQLNQVELTRTEEMDRVGNYINT